MRDRVVVSDYLDSVREIERRVQMASKQDRPRWSIPDAPVGTPNDITEHFKLMFDLMALAFQADITRVITFSMDREASMRTYTNLGIAEGFHPLSHHGNNPQKLDKLVQIQKYHTEVFADSSRRSKAQRRRRHGAGSLHDSVRQRHEQQRSAQQRSAAVGGARAMRTERSKAAST